MALEVKVDYASENFDEMSRELLKTEANMKLVEKRVTSMKKKADTKHLLSQTKEYQEQVDRLAKSSKKAADASRGMGSSFLVSADAAKNLAMATVAATKATHAFALEGAVAADVAAKFGAMAEGAAPSLDRLADATAGVVDDTSLQKYAILASEAGLTAKQMIGLAQNITVAAEKHGELENVSEILSNTLRGELEGLKKVGIFIDLSDKKYAGLTETVKKQKIAMDLSTEGTQAQVDALQSLQAELLKTSTAAQNAESDLSVAAAKALKASGQVEVLTFALEGAAAGLNFITGALADNSDELDENTRRLMTAQEVRHNSLLIDQARFKVLAEIGNIDRTAALAFIEKEIEASRQLLEEERSYAAALLDRGDIDGATRKAGEESFALTAKILADSTAAKEASITATTASTAAIQEEISLYGQLTASIETVTSRLENRIALSDVVTEQRAAQAEATAAAIKANEDLAASFREIAEAQAIGAAKSGAAGIKKMLDLEKKVAAERMAIGQASIDSAAQVAGAIFESQGAVYGLKALGEVAAMWGDIGLGNAPGAIAHGTSAALYTAAAVSAGSGGGGGGGGGGPSAGAAASGSAQATVLSGTNEGDSAQEAGRAQTRNIYVLPNVIMTEAEKGAIIAGSLNEHANQGGQGSVDNRINGLQQQGQAGQ